MDPSGVTALIGLVDWVAKLTPPGLFLLALVGFVRKWWVPGWLYMEVKAERDKALLVIEALSQTALRAATAAERKTGPE